MMGEILDFSDIPDDDFDANFADDEYLDYEEEDPEELSLEVRADNISNNLQDLKTNIELMQVDRADLDDKIKEHQAKHDNLRANFVLKMQKNQIEKIQTRLESFTIRESESLKITDKKKIPEKYTKTTTTTTTTIDNKTIKAELLKDENLKIEGAEIVKSNSLCIRKREV